MRKTNDGKNNDNSVATVILNCFICAAISFLIFLAATLILNLLKGESSYIKENSKLILYSALTVSCIINGFLCAVKIKIRAIVASSISAAIFAALLFILFVIVNGFNFTVFSLISIVTVFAVTVVSSIIFKNIKR